MILTPSLRLQYPLAFCNRIHEHYLLERGVEPNAEVFDQLVVYLRPRSAGVGLDGRDVVLADAEVVGELALGEAAFLPRRL